MHAMQEMSDDSHHSTGMNGHESRMHELDMDADADESKLQNALLTVVGMLAPLITYLGPHHAH